MTQPTGTIRPKVAKRYTNFAGNMLIPLAVAVVVVVVVLLALVVFVLRGQPEPKTEFEWRFLEEEEGDRS